MSGLRPLATSVSTIRRVTSEARHWFIVCMPDLPWPICIDE